jgi:ATP-binding cassette, subfamily B, bacterial HlyB/CyaB
VILIFDEATSALDGETAESFAKTINQLKGKVTMLFITHAMPKALRVDGVLRIDPHGGHLIQQQDSQSASAVHQTTSV